MSIVAPVVKTHVRAGALPGPPSMVPAGTVVLQANAQALALEQGVLGPASPIPTQCLLLKNMFNPAECALAPLSPMSGHKVNPPWRDLVLEAHTARPCSRLSAPCMWDQAEASDCLALPCRGWHKPFSSQLALCEVHEQTLFINSTAVLQATCRRWRWL